MDNECLLAAALNKTHFISKFGGGVMESMWGYDVDDDDDEGAEYKRESQAIKGTTKETRMRKREQRYHRISQANPHIRHMDVDKGDQSVRTQRPVEFNLRKRLIIE